MKTRYPSKLSTRVAISFAASIFLSGVIFCVIQFTVSLAQLNNLEKKAYVSLNELSDVNYDLQLKAIAPFARDLLKSLAERYSIQITEKLQKFKAVPIREIPGIYELSTADIKPDGNHVGYFTLVDKTGKIIFSHNKEKYEGKNVRDFQGSEFFDTSSVFFGKGNLEDKILTKSEYEIESTRKDYYIVSEKIPDTDYILLGFVDMKKAIRPIFANYTNEQKKVIDSLDRNLTDEFNKSWLLGFGMFFGVIAVLSAVFACSGFLLAKYISKPIVKLRDVVLAFSYGDFDAHVKEEGTVETVHLARSFNHLGNKLKKYMQSLKDETRRLEAVQSELRIARKIQMSLLPDLSKDFRRDNFFISKVFKPAREVGGDFYDFFYIDDSRETLAVILGDISGKGVPAALLMGVIKTTLRNFCINFNLLLPGKVLSKVNADLFSNNKENMFASVFLMYYDIRTGVLSFANAGHHSSIFIHASEKRMSYFGAFDQPVLGIFNDSEYETGTLQLQKTDSVICYTDGLTDSTSPEGLRFGEKRLVNLVDNNITKRADEIIQIISKEAIDFQKDNLFDDLTMLSLIRNS
ncbi:MAG TPA: hypothetical protein DD381_07710 [Lentisphaeria bacterium]|nr:MAG: hypothetical protein A2X47_04275 [Lentisphaerae bacterium GWF2_38_69]HBM16207.1 hypothetical protein [Lentisphaeria bacterium]